MERKAEGGGAGAEVGGGKGKHLRSGPGERGARDREVWALWRAGRSQASIAQALGCSEATVWRTVKRIYEGASELLNASPEDQKVLQLGDLQVVMEAAFQEWEKHHNPRLLAEMRGVLADQRKVLGLDAPRKTETEIKLTGFEGWTDEELEEYARTGRKPQRTPGKPSGSAAAG